MILHIEIEVGGAKRPLVLELDMDDNGYNDTAAMLRVPTSEWANGKEFVGYQMVPVRATDWVDHDDLWFHYREEKRVKRGVYDYRSDV
jgi:hypothetical protein